jgi:hypothetical protein
VNGNGRNRQELQWQLLRTFFRSRSSFLKLFNSYEERVASFAEKLATDRSRLKLPADELQSLLDFKSLEELRDREILKLKEIAHELFRAKDSTDRLDHFISNIYHEISILKEEHYTLKEDFVRMDQREYDRFFREVAEFYPKRLRHVKNLYQKALRRLEEILPEMSGERIVVRSLFLFGEDLLVGAYRNGLKGLYSHMYPDLGDVGGYAVAGRSFLESGFTEEALQAFRAALELYGRKRRKKKGPALAALVEELKSEVERLEAA